MTRAEYALFLCVHYGIDVPPDDLPRVALSEFNPDHRSDPLTETECVAALADCFAKEWLRVIDAAILAELRAELERDGVLGPVYGWPEEGTVDFTPAGAEMWHRADNPAVANRRQALAESAGLRTVPGTSASDPAPCGAWAAGDRAFARGFRVLVEWRGWHAGFAGLPCAVAPVGPGDDARAFIEVERRVDLYCADHDGLPAAVAEFARDGWVRADPVECIHAPWCVYWWERYPYGFRQRVTVRAAAP